MAENTDKVRHSKIKNTGILFELLTRQLTSDIITGVSKSKAQELIEKNFKSDTPLGKEHRLYQLLVKQKMSDQAKANNFIDEVISSHRKLNKTEIRKMKYNLVREIKENFPIEKFFKNKIDNYKLMASIYKLFQAKSLNEEISPSDIVESRWTILEHITGVSQTEKSTDNDPVSKMIVEFEKQNKDLRLLTYKVMVDKFNSKYSVLNESQKELIKQYINNLSSTNTLLEYIVEQVPIVTEELKKCTTSIDDQVTKIKVNEVLNQLSGMKDLAAVTDNHVEAMLHTYELVKELKSIESKKVV